MLFNLIITHNLDKSLKERAASRKSVGPYMWTPAKPGGKRGFYQASDGLTCDKHGSVFDLRLRKADDYDGGGVPCYYGAEQPYYPIVAALPHKRGFLAGCTMGPGMCAEISLSIFTEPADAARYAHEMASDAAQSNERETEDVDGQDRESYSDDQDRESYTIDDGDDDRTHVIRLDDAEHATVLAALRYYQQQGMGDPANRSDDIHAIATGCYDGATEVISLDAEAIDDLCERINC